MGCPGRHYYSYPRFSPLPVLRAYVRVRGTRRVREIAMAREVGSTGEEVMKEGAVEVIRKGTSTKNDSR